MFNFLHSFEPQPILLGIGPISLHWYGLCLVLGMAAALIISLRLSDAYSLKRNDIFDLAFWLIVGGLIGARLYDVALELPYYIAHPWRIFAVWQGGLAIHGAIIAGLIIIWLFSRRRNLPFLKLISLIAPGLALGQAIGRWGNYFNQELFGRPTDLPWGIPISLINRPAEYITSTHFHPTFLYESLVCLTIFLALYIANQLAAKHKRLSENFFVWSAGFYVILYSISRFSLEYIKIDKTPAIAGLRWPQIMSLILIAGTLAYITIHHACQKKKS